MKLMIDLISQIIYANSPPTLENTRWTWDSNDSIHDSLNEFDINSQHDIYDDQWLDYPVAESERNIDRQNVNPPLIIEIRFANNFTTRDELNTIAENNFDFHYDQGYTDSVNDFDSRYNEWFMDTTDGFAYNQRNQEQHTGNDNTNLLFRNETLDESTAYVQWSADTVHVHENPVDQSDYLIFYGSPTFELCDVDFSLNGFTVTQTDLNELENYIETNQTNEFSSHDFFDTSTIEGTETFETIVISDDDD